MSLTNRQTEVLALMALGYNNEAIADTLVIGEKAVENYIHHIYQELELANKPGLNHRVAAVLHFLGHIEFT